MVSHIVLRVWFAWCLHGVRQVSGKLIYACYIPLMFICRGGGGYVMCAKSVAVTLMCMHCFEKSLYFSVSIWMKETIITICCSSRSANVLCVLINFV